MGIFYRRAFQDTNSDGNIKENLTEVFVSILDLPDCLNCSFWGILSEEKKIRFFTDKEKMEDAFLKMYDVTPWENMVNEELEWWNEKLSDEEDKGVFAYSIGLDEEAETELFLLLRKQ